eukprot:403361220
MTTPAQSQARVFNPSAFQNPDDQADQSSAQQSQTEQKEYPVTGNSARDSVRKMLYEVFLGEQEDNPALPLKFSVAQIGPRFEQSRQDLRSGAIDAATLIRDDYVQGKNVPVGQNQGLPQQQQQQHQNLAPRMTPGAQIGGFRPPGPGGMRPRMMPGGIGQAPMFRPPGGPAAGFNRPPVPVQNINQIQQQQTSQEQSSINQRTVEQDRNEDQSQVPKHEESNQVLQSNSAQQDQQQKRLNGSQSSTAIHGIVNQDEIGNQPAVIKREIAPSQKQSINKIEENRDKSLNSSQNRALNGSLSLQNLNQSNDQIQEHETLNSQHLNDQLPLSKTIQQQQQQQNVSNMNITDQSVEISQDKAIGIDDSIISNEKKPAKKKKKVKGKKKANVSDEKCTPVEQQLEENINQAQQILQPQLDDVSKNRDSLIEEQKQEQNANNNIESSQNQKDEQITGLNSNYQFLDQSSSVIFQDRDDSILENRILKKNESNKMLLLNDSQLMNNLEHQSSANQSDERLEFTQPMMKSQVEQSNPSSKHSTQDRVNLLQEQKSNNQVEIEEERKTPQKHRAKQQSIDERANIQIDSFKQTNVKEQKLSKNPSVKSLAHSSNTQQNNNVQSVDSDSIKRLQDALSYKRHQKKELTEKIVHLENDIHLQQRKAAMLMEENKTVREELRNKDKELKSLQSKSNEKVNQFELQNRKLEGSFKEKQQEIEQLKREVQRQKEEKQTYKERVQIINEESQHQRQILDNLLKSLESKMNSSGVVAQQIQGVSSSVVSAASGNQNEIVEQLQREMREMKTNYEQRIRDLNEELNTRIRLQQRTERQNIQLQERNNQLQDLLSQVELQQLSTVAGSGSNQRDSTALLNRRQGGGSNDNDNQHTHRAYEEEGTGGDGGYNQSSQSNARNQMDYLFPDEGGNAAVVGGLSENFDNDSNQNLYDGGSTQRNQRSTQNYQIEAVSGGHPQFDDEPDQEDDIEDEDEYDEDDVDNTNHDDDFEDEEGNQFDDNTQGIASVNAHRDNQATGQHNLNQNMTNYQGDNNDGYAGGQQTLPPRQRKQGSRRRGNRQQNQQHTTGQSSVVTQNPRQRNSRGRQQRSNQQHVQQQLQIGAQNSQTETHPSHAPSSAPSSQYRQMQQTQNAPDYFQNFGENSSSTMNNQNRDQSASSAINIPHSQFGNSQRDGAVVGQGVVLTAGRQNAVDSMMSAESGSTATAFLDKNQFHRGHQQPGRQQNQTSSLQSVQQNQQMHFQTGSNNQNNQQQTAIQQLPADLFNDSDNYTAAVGAPTSRAAAHPRQSRQQVSNQNQQNQFGVLQFNEEVKQSSGEIPSYYQQQNANQSSMSGGTIGSSVRMNQNQIVGGSGEQEEDSSSVFFGGGASGSQASTIQQQNLQNYHPHGTAGGLGSAFDSTRRNQTSVQQMRQGISSTPTRNDSRKTSGANTPNKEGADTPTTKAYRNQQQQNSYVHNLTTNQFLFSNQDDGDQSSLFGGIGSVSQAAQQRPQQQHHGMHPLHQQNAQMIQPNQQQQHQQQQQQFGREPDIISPNMFE